MWKRQRPPQEGAVAPPNEPIATPSVEEEASSSPDESSETRTAAPPPRLSLEQAVLQAARTPEERNLAAAWFVRRRAVKEGRRQRQQARSSPLDLDEAVEDDSDEEDDEEAAAVFVTNSDCVSLSAVSVATSGDRTAIVNNLGHHHHPNPKQVAPLHSFSDDGSSLYSQRNPPRGDPYSNDGLMEERPFQDEVLSSTAHSRSRRRRLDGFFDIRTTQGKVVVLLVCLLVLAIFTMVASAVVAQQRQQQQESNDPSTGRTFDPVDVIIMSAAPTMLPTLSPTTVSPTAFPTTVSPTAFPTTTMPTLVPSTFPSMAPSTRPSSTPSIVASVIPTATASSFPTTSSPTVMASNQPSAFLLDWILQDTQQGPQQGDGFGTATALSANGQVLVVGVPFGDAGSVVRTGQVWIYQRNKRSNWILLQTLAGEASGDAFGSAVAVSADGSVVAASAPMHDGVGDRSGQVRVFRRTADGLSYTQLGPSLNGMAALAYFGVGLAVSGDYLCVGAPFFSAPLALQGQVRVYQLQSIVSNNGSTTTTTTTQTSSHTEYEWILTGTPITGTAAYDWLGSAVDLHVDSHGDDHDSLVLAVAAPRGGYVRVFDYDGNTQDWRARGAELRLPGLADDYFGHSISLDGANRLAVGMPQRDQRTGLDAGLVQVFSWDDTAAVTANQEWSLQGKALVGDTSGARLGTAVALRGNTLVVGGTASVAVWRWRPNDNGASSSWRLEMSQSVPGTAVSLALEDDDSSWLLVAGAPSRMETGHVRTYASVA